MLSALILPLEAQRLIEIERAEEEINRMYQSDQKAREAFIQDPENLHAIKSMQSLDEHHTKTIKSLLDHYEWIDASLFGKETSEQAITLILHASHALEFQRECLFILSKKKNKTAYELKQLAYLHDKVAVNSGLRQRYGTQFSIEPQGVLKLKPYEGSIKEIDKRREAIGLDPLEAYLEAAQSHYKKPTG